MNTPRILSRNWPHWGVSHNAPASRSAGASPMTQLHDEIDRLFNGMFTGLIAPWDNFSTDMLPASSRQALADVSISPRVELTSDDKAYTLTAELPGVDPADVKLEVHDNMLFMRGEKKRENAAAPQKDGGEAKAERRLHVTERAYGSFERAMSLPEDANAEAISACHKDGVLTVVIPRKAEESPKTRTIERTRA